MLQTWRSYGAESLWIDRPAAWLNTGSFERGGDPSCRIEGDREEDLVEARLSPGQAGEGHANGPGSGGAVLGELGDGVSDE